MISPRSSWAKPEPALESHLSVFDHELNSKHFPKLVFLQVLNSMCRICLPNVGGTLWHSMIYPWAACTTRAMHVFLILDCSQSNLWQLFLHQPNPCINQKDFWHWALHFPPNAEEGLRSWKILLFFIHNAFWVVVPWFFSKSLSLWFSWTLYEKLLVYIAF